jgi:hypothetical protein
MTAGSSSINYKCAAATSRQRMHLPLLMQWTQPKHPVLRCVLLAYDAENSPLNRRVTQRYIYNDIFMCCWPMMLRTVYSI